MRYLSFILMPLLLWACSEKKNDPSFYGEDIEAIIAKMSIEEKVGQMTQINLDVISKGEIFNLVEPHELDPIKLDSAINYYFVGSVLNVGGHTYSREHWEKIITEIQTKAVKEGNGIPIIYGIDAIHGVNYTMDATLFPQQIGQAATWNPDLVSDGAAVAAYECRASGIPWNFSPVLDLARHPLWSRFFETYGEDVFLAKTMSAAAIQGYQGNDPSNPEKVAACMKHFIGYSMPISGKDRTPAWIPERQLREYFLPTFEAAIEQNALTLMVNSGEVNGIPVHADYDLLTTLLRDELGFKGLVVTDWEDIIKLYRDHKVAKDMREAVKIAVLAGIDMSMTPNDYSFNEALIDLVKSGEVPESRLDESCRRILWVKKQLGLLSQALPDFKYYTKFASQEHKEKALQTAQESITLLKNDNDVLPLKKGSKVLLCGPAANSLNIINGAWTHTWQGVDTNYNTKGALTIFQAMQQINPGQVSYVIGSGLEEEVNIAAAVSAAKNNDVVVVCLGEIPSTEKPGDIEDLNLPKAQQNLVRELSKTGKPIILVFAFNRPLIVREIEPLASAIVHTYLPGDFGGVALSKILFGDVNPSGKLPFTYPRHTGSLLFYDHKHTELLDKDFGYNTFNPQWEFGFGLSYSRFAYSNLKIDKKSYVQSDVVRISVDIKNDSPLSGKEVVQVYISDLVASITPSVKRLRAFSKVYLDAGETKTVEIEMPISELAFVNRVLKWIVEPGEFVLQVQNLKEKFDVKD
jgi:beta-glucosidase